MTTCITRREGLALVQSLRHRRERDRTGLAYVEGVRFVSEAAALGPAIETLVVAPHYLRSPYGQQLVRRLRDHGIPCVELTPAEYERVSEAADGQGIGACVRQRWTPLPTTNRRRAPFWLAVGEVQSPGNLGTAIRSADAFGAAGIILLGDQPDPYDPGAIRATMGSLFAVPMIRTGLCHLNRWRREHGVHLVGASPTAKQDCRSLAHGAPTVVLVGSERKGLSSEQAAACDELVCIPMVGRADSLNLGVAASVLLYEVYRGRHPT